MRAVSFQGIPLTAAKVRQAFRQFDEKERGGTVDCGTGYVVHWRGKRYPPKSVLRLASSVKRFAGGETTNRVFRLLGFQVGADTDAKRLDAPCPKCASLVEQAFSQRWARFDVEKEVPSLQDDHWPGVYVLAFCGEDLANKRVREEKVFYVGMSSIRLRNRLKQFRDGLQDGHHHSAAKRFFWDKNLGNGKPFNEKKSAKKFFVAAVCVPCRYRKPERKELDLQKLGTIASLEYFVLGRIKRKTSKEPPLNRK